MRGGGFPSRFSFVVIHFAVILVVKSNVLPFLISVEGGWGILKAFSRSSYKVLGLN